MYLRVFAFFVLLTIAPLAIAEDLATLGEMIRQGHTGEARTRLRKAVEEFRAAHDIRGEGISLLLLGFAETELRNSDAARTSLDAASLKLAESGDFYSAWMARLFVAASDIGESRWDQALRDLEETLTMLHAAAQSDTPLTFDALKAIGGVLNMDTSPLSMLEGQPAMIKRAVLLMCEALTRDTLGGVLIEVGRLEHAEKELDQASGLSRMMLGALDAPIAAHYGELRRRQWRLDEARRHFLESLRGIAWIPLPSDLKEPMELRAMARLAEIELLDGSPENALEWNDRQLQFVRERHQIHREISILRERATLLMQANRYDDSQRVLEDARAMAERTDVCLHAEILTDLGSLEMYRGKYGAAAKQVERAIELYQSVNDSLMEGHAWTMLAETYLAMGAFDNVDLALEHVRELALKSHFKPAELLAEALALQRKWMSGQGTATEAAAALDRVARMAMVEGIPFTPEVAALFGDLMRYADDPAGLAGVDPNVRGETAVPIAANTVEFLRGRNLLLSGDSARAREIWTAALERASSADFRGGLLAGIGITHVKDGDMTEAAQWFRRAADLVDDEIGNIADDDLLARYLGSPRGLYFDIAINAMAADGNARGAFLYSERARSRAFLQIVGNHRIEPRSDGSDRLAAEAESLRMRIAQWEREGSPASDLDNARTRYRAILSRLKTSSPEYASLLRIEPSDIDALQSEVPEGTTLISYYLTNWGGHAWIVERDSLEYVPLPLSSRELSRAVCWSDRMRSQGRGVRRPEQICDDPASPEEVFDLFVAPLQKKIRTDRLMIVPHRAMHQFPFGAMIDRKSGRYLIEDYTLFFAPSASALPFLRAKETPVEGTALVIGSPAGEMGPLAGAAREAEIIAKNFGTKAWSGSEATEDLLYHLNGSVDLIHIGAHGTFNAASPLFSRILLAPGGGRDGNLDVHEILSEVDWRGVNLVVLSACRTGVGERTGGDDITGLTRAVLYAGCPGVISTLWEIDDSASAELMESFYGRLLDGNSAADALREAQLMLLRDPRYSDPRYWAAFMVTGDPQGRFDVRRR